MNTLIELVDAREILDSRGNPTVEVDVILGDGSVGRAAVPSGASTGAHEAVELRDGDKSRFGGKGVLTAVAQRDRPDRAASCSAWTPRTRPASTTLLRDLDGTPNKADLGANAILGVSLACAHAAAAAHELPLYRYLGGVGARILPGPDVQHPQRRQARPGLDRLPGVHGRCRSARRPSPRRSAPEPRSSPRCGRSSTTRATRPARATRAASPRSLASNEAAVEVILRAIEKAGYRPGEDVAIALDPATTELVEEGTRRRRRADPLPPRDREPDARLRRADRPLGRLGRPLSDRLDRGRPGRGRLGGLGASSRAGSATGSSSSATTCSSRTPSGSQRAIDEDAANSVLIKLNQIGTLTETIEAIALARRAGWTAIVSHRSGETEDTTIADLVVAMGTGQIKTGAPSR